MIALLPSPAIGCQGVLKLPPVYGAHLSKQDGQGAGNFEGSGPLTRAAGVSTRRELQGPWDEPRSEVGATAVCSPTNLTGARSSGCAALRSPASRPTRGSADCIRSVDACLTRAWRTVTGPPWSVWWGRSLNACPEWA